MSLLLALTVSMALVLGATLAVVLFLRRPLQALLLELCGDEARARFWSVYWCSALVLAALLGLLVSLPLGDVRLWSETPGVPLVLAGLRASLWAVLLVKLALALVLLGAIGRFERKQLAAAVAAEA